MIDNLTIEELSNVTFEFVPLDDPRFQSATKLWSAIPGKVQAETEPVVFFLNEKRIGIFRGRFFPTNYCSHVEKLKTHPYRKFQVYRTRFGLMVAGDVDTFNTALNKHLDQAV